MIMMKEKILFMGTPPIARTMLERLVSEGYEIMVKVIFTAGLLFMITIAIVAASTS